MSELHIGQRVRTPYGALVVVDMTDKTVSAATREEVDGLYRFGAAYIHHIPRSEVEPLPPDVPRAAVEDLLAALDKELARAEFPEDAHAALEHLATALRKLLGGES